jgi:probable HAF family extracellular repeat protein
MTDLGTVGRDPCAFAQGVNDENQVVGDSSPNCNFDFSRAFLWEHGSMIDLNALVPPTSPLQLIYAYTINHRGEIAVNGIDANGIEQAALLVPCDQDHPDVEGCDYGLMDAAASTQSQSPAPHRLPGSRQRGPLSRPTTLYHLPGTAGTRTGTESEGQDAQPASPINGNRMANHVMNSTETPSLRGLCSVSGSVLTGWCIAPQGLHCVSKKNPVQCPAGQKAKQPQQSQCGVFGRPVVDIASRCSIY